MKAIIELGPRGSVFSAVSAQLAAEEAERPSEDADYRFFFESARSLFSELTPARIDLLDRLHSVGPCSVYALAKACGRNYSNVHSDVAKLEEHELVKRTSEGEVMVPFDSIEIRLDLVKRAA